jgi:hypothetical protein
MLLLWVAEAVELQVGRKPRLIVHMDKAAAAVVLAMLVLVFHQITDQLH